MNIIADLHIHSHYSRATSKRLDFEHLYLWAQMKGVNLLGTGDIAHPGWLAEMREKLEPAEAGLFRLRDQFAAAMQGDVPPATRNEIRFMLAGEISNIYKRGGKVRKVHNVIFAPSLETVAQIQAALEKIGNIRADGRPILGLDSRDLLEIILDIDPRNHLIPAHIWTPWFSMLGSKSGFDSVTECFDDLTPHIFALETGLSSDPPMNWRVSQLDNYALVSNSDAHSPQKLAREATLFDTEFSYEAIFAALKSRNPQQFLGTLEFFPEEGKYHLDGHRKCGIRWSPGVTLANQSLCPVCGKPVTVGVSHRIETLADRPDGGRPAHVQPFESLIPLPEILSEVLGVGPTSKRVQRAYSQLLTELGSELAILRDTTVADIEQAGGTLLAEGIRRMRAGQVITIAGYDGEFGRIKLFNDAERDQVRGQMALFNPPRRKPTHTPTVAEAPAKFTPGATSTSMPTNTASHPELNPEQRAAVETIDAPLLIVAGPGTGKTRTLTHRLAHLVRSHHVEPGHILAVTFTNKAAAEMAQRLAQLLPSGQARAITVKTFHALGVQILQAEGHHLGLPHPFAVADDADRAAIAKLAWPDASSADRRIWLDHIATAKNLGLSPGEEAPAAIISNAAELTAGYAAYQQALLDNQMLDFDDLLRLTIDLFEAHPHVLRAYQQRFQSISVDEYQDINAAQYRLLRLLTAAGSNLCVIGDPDQAIYAFRGADRRYFLQFERDFPNAKRVQLTRNYRSTPAILNAAGQVIAANPTEARPDLQAEMLDPARLTIYQAPSVKAEAEYVVHRIEQMLGGTSYFSHDSGRIDDDTLPILSLADFAVLYRLKTQAADLAEAFERSGMPFQIVGRRPTESPEMQAILAHLWFLNVPAPLYLHRIAHLVSPTITPATLTELQQTAAGRNQSLWHLVTHPQGVLLPTRQQKAVEKLGGFLLSLKSAAPTEPVSALLKTLQRRYRQALSKESRAALAELITQAAPFERRLREFLLAQALQQPTDTFNPRADRIPLMTLHAAKGLEFPVVFIVGCEVGLLPFHRPGEVVDVEEERRLFYVGMTRARQKLYLLHSKQRTLFGEHLQPNPSPFLADIEAKLAEWERHQPKAQKQEKTGSQLNLF